MQGSTPRLSDREPNPVLECRGLCKRFYYYEHRTTTLREWLIRFVLRKPIHVRRAEFELSDLNLRIEPGEFVALIGANGSGKSSLLRLMAGIYQPSEGSVVARGRIAPIIELGAGFHPELTGAENIALYATVLGLGSRELASRMDEIVAFSELAQFLDTPVKYFSSGMTARLAFSIAICVEPDILLLDEVLAVGDRAFRERCLAGLAAFHARGGTIVLVTHELDQARKLCSRAVWLDRGRIRMDGEATRVFDAYEQAQPR